VRFKTVDIELRAKINSTEDKSKIISAISNIVDLDKEYGDESLSDLIILKSSDIFFLSPLYNRLREQQILEAVRNVLLTNKTDTLVVLHLNRQAAFSNRIHVCELSGESPLGPITIIIRSKKIDDFIDWLTPQTIDGKPVTPDKESLSLEDL